MLYLCIHIFSIVVMCAMAVVQTDIRSCRRYSYSNRPSQDCSSCGLTNPPKLFHSVISLNLANNSLGIVDNFPTAYNTLLSLRMDHCSIKAIKPKALFQLTNLKNLDLSYNQLEHIQIGRSVSLLTTLNLSHNKLRHIPDFSSLNSLRLLDLSYNNLISIIPQHLPYNLESLRLTANYLSHLTHWSFLEKLQELDVSFNPLVCECSLWKFVTWAEQMALFDSSTLPCRKPASLRRSLSGEIFCGPDIHESKEITRSIVSLGDPLQLCCTVASSPAAYVFWRHENKNITKGLTTSPLAESGRARFCLDIASMTVSSYGTYSCVAKLGDVYESKNFIIERDKIPIVANSAEQLVFYAQFSICAFVGIFCVTCCCCLRRANQKTKIRKTRYHFPEFVPTLDYLNDNNDPYLTTDRRYLTKMGKQIDDWDDVENWRNVKSIMHAPLAKFDSETNITTTLHSSV